MFAVHVQIEPLRADSDDFDSTNNVRVLTWLGSRGSRESYDLVLGDVTHEFRGDAGTFTVEEHELAKGRSYDFEIFHKGSATDPPAFRHLADISGNSLPGSILIEDPHDILNVPLHFHTGPVNFTPGVLGQIHIPKVDLVPFDSKDMDYYNEPSFALAVRFRQLRSDFVPKWMCLWTLMSLSEKH